jgi:carbonic anhydrase
MTEAYRCSDQSVPRREFLRTAATLGAAVAGLGVPSLLRAATAPVVAPRLFDVSIRPDEALERLLDGNRRFADGRPLAPHRDLARLREVEPKQTPFAAVLGCADSRVPVEILFDQGFGDLFPVRVAGNVVSPEIVASLEFGCAVLGAQVLVVLGHSRCGAVKATLDGGAVPGQISALYQHIQPAVDVARGDLDTAILANVRNQAALLRRASPVLAAMIRESTLRIVGAVFDLASGRVSVVDT